MLVSYLVSRWPVRTCKAYDREGLLCGGSPIILYPVELCSEHEYLLDPKRLL